MSTQAYAGTMTVGAAAETLATRSAEETRTVAQAKAIAPGATASVVCGSTSGGADFRAELRAVRRQTGGTKMKRMLFIATGFMVLTLATGWCAETITSDSGVTPAVEAALLKEDWQQVADLLPDSVCSNSVVASMLKGHACLALNRNNDSLFLFLQGYAQDTNAVAWLTWTRRIAASHPERVLSGYLKADALARTGDLNSALKELAKHI